MSESKQALINLVLTILFIFIIAISSKNFGKYYLAEIIMEFDKIRKPNTIPKPIMDNSPKAKTKCINKIRIKKSLSKEYYKNLNKLAQNAQQYAKKHNLNKKYCLLVDYSLPSGTPRCFLWDFKNNNLKTEMHALHGSGGGSTPEKPVFSNKINSHCSSLGHYKITKRRGHMFPRGFYMRGLDKTNSNAEARAIMIHPSDWADYYKEYEFIPLGGSLGCVSITTEGINILEPIILKETELLLLWSFTSFFPEPFEQI